MTPRQALENLKIGSGGKGSTVIVHPGLMVSLAEGTRDSGFPFAISVLFNARRTTIGLTDHDVATKGKSKWRRDNLWRLTPECVNRFEHQLAILVEKLIILDAIRKLNMAERMATLTVRS